LDEHVKTLLSQAPLAVQPDDLSNAGAGSLSKPERRV
jgi:hypothetical protein